MIPYHSDAPLYHWPIATCLLIGLCTLSFLLVPAEYLEPHSQVGVIGEVEEANGPLEDGVNAFQPGVRRRGRGRDDGWQADAFRIVEEAGGQPGPAAELGGTAVGPNRWFPATLGLEHGVGLKPWQWFSGLFLHENVWQLLVNMVVLWAFGMVVEGKIGGPMFLGIFLGIGGTQSAIEQLLTSMGPHSVSAGANAVLLGLLGIAVVWVPRNEFDVFWGFGFRAGSIEIPILLYGFIQFALELVGVAFGRGGISTSMLHMIGLLLGFGVGWVWLRRGWVDCEGWDLINVWHGREATIDEDHQLADEARQLVRSTTRGVKSASNSKNASSKPARRALSAVAHSNTVGKHSDDKSDVRSDTNRFHDPLRRERALVDVEQLIADGNLATALKLLNKLRATQPTLQLSQLALYQLIQQLLKGKQYAEAIPFMREHLSRFVEQRESMQVNLAKLLLHLQQPRKALDVLNSVQLTSLKRDQQKSWQSLVQHAQHQIDEGTIELSES